MEQETLQKTSLAKIKQEKIPIDERMYSVIHNQYYAGALVKVFIAKNMSIPINNHAELGLLKLNDQQMQKIRAVYAKVRIYDQDWNL